jgi:hypothetical protein
LGFGAGLTFAASTAFGAFTPAKLTPSTPTIAPSNGTASGPVNYVYSPIGVTRFSILPDVPSLKELGVSIQYAQWSCLFVAGLGIKKG